MRFGGGKTREERKICLKICLFGFPEVLVMEAATTVPREVVSSSTLIGPFEFERELTTRPSTGGKRTFCRESSVPLGLPRAITSGAMTWFSFSDLKWSTILLMAVEDSCLNS